MVHLGSGDFLTQQSNCRRFNEANEATVKSVGRTAFVPCCSEEPNLRCYRASNQALRSSGCERKQELASVDLSETEGTHGTSTIPPGSDMIGSERMIWGGGRRRERETRVAPTKKPRFYMCSCWLRGMNDGAREIHTFIVGGYLLAEVRRVAVLVTR